MSYTAIPEVSVRCFFRCQRSGSYRDHTEESATGEPDRYAYLFTGTRGTGTNYGGEENSELRTPTEDSRLGNAVL